MPLGLSFNDEQEHLRRGVRSFLAKRSDEDRVREVMGGGDGLDEQLWRGMAAELGCQGLSVPEELGGANATLVEQGVVFEELGRSLACVPYLATVGLALDLLQHLNHPGTAKWVQGIATGELVATVALVEPDRGWDPSDVAIEAQQQDDCWSLTGTKTYVPDGHLAGLILVVARVADDLAVFAVDPDAPGVSVTQLPTMDQTRRQARLDLDHASAQLLDATAGTTLVRSLARACALLAVEQVGAAREVLERTTSYVGIRKQFGHPIGSFQAVKHRLADMLLDVEAARSAAYYALFVAAEDDEELLAASSLAKAFCSDMLVRTTEAAIQLHGGIGLTWEHWAHLYLKRAWSSAVLLGNA